MERPKMTSLLLGSEWVAHVSTDAAWDDMQELVDSEPERAWRVIQLVVGAAPDYGVLSAIAAGPLEDLIDQHGDAFIPQISAKAKASTRMRICLGATYSNLPSELKAIVEAEKADVRDLPAETDTSATAEDLALIVSWIHHSDTAWAAQFLNEMIVSDPAAAWDVLRVLLVFAQEDGRIQSDVFEDAFEPFMRRHFNNFREKLEEVAQKSSAFRQWVRDRSQPPIDDETAWAAFVSGIPAS